MFINLLPPKIKNTLCYRTCGTMKRYNVTKSEKWCTTCNAKSRALVYAAASPPKTLTFWRPFVILFQYFYKTKCVHFTPFVSNSRFGLCNRCNWSMVNMVAMRDKRYHKWNTDFQMYIAYNTQRYTHVQSLDSHIGK